ncbi:MAG TPA: ferrochelatase [Thermoanaerobaculia bacterium]|nr:ferrochelatase [Thermoanaerobaculia bacterium]
MIRYRGEPRAAADDAPGIGVLLANLGTPAAPTARALRPYLRQFLWDPRVIELPRWRWWLILHLAVLTTRPKSSAALYRKVWTPEGSPLLKISRCQANGVAARLAGLSPRVEVALGMRYGEPSIAGALRELAAKGCRRILVVPLYPQYAAATTASTFDAVFAELAAWRWAPELRTVASYHDERGYVAALAQSIAELWRREGEPERLLLSFHGMPVRYAEAGDPYPRFCQESARLVRERLGFPAERTIVAFQSRFGREPWLEPYTDQTLKALPGQGVRSVDALCPGFSADCLETLEEIDGMNRDFFLHAGGERFRYVPCLNDRDDHLDFLAELATRHLGGWLDEPAAAGGPALDAAARRRQEGFRAPGFRLAGEAASHPEG